MKKAEEQHGVSLNRFASEEINNSFVAFASEYGMLRVHALAQDRFAVELTAAGRPNRYLTQSEADSFHYEMRASDGIRELRVELE